MANLFIDKLSPALANAMAKMELASPVDVLTMLPTHIDSWQEPTPPEQFSEGEIALVAGEVVSHRLMYTSRGRQLIVQLQLPDGSLIQLRYFRVTQALLSAFPAGRQLQAKGKLYPNPKGWQMFHPRLQSAQQTGKQTPIYRTTKGVHSTTLQKLVAVAMQQAYWEETPLPSHLIPADLLERCPRRTAFLLAHSLADRPHPPSDHPVLRWLCFEEMLAHQIILRGRYFAAHHAAVQVAPDPTWQAQWIDELPFTLTPSQQQAITAIGKDLQQQRPMRRLLQGDVGSGKTIVAAFACALVAKNGNIAAIMAPTEILAEQHATTFTQILKSSRLHCELITGATKGKDREAALRRLHHGISKIAIGTHALFQESIVLPNLALAVIDEQQRFGVQQRQALTKKAADVHQLMMSATPIPRTLAMSIFADSDVSTLTEKPANRQNVQTVTLDDRRRAQVVERVSEHIGAGGKVYWVCPLIDETDSDAFASLMTIDKLAKIIARRRPDIKFSTIHGRMKDKEKRQTMQDFMEGKFDLLIATTVIEVGVDVPQADVMIIEHADRLGLSQLHQIRGRVGRGDKKGYCLLLYQAPLTPEAEKRLKIIRECDDGFKIAHYDLALRGAGQWLGVKQSGMPTLSLATLPQDRKLAVVARQVADWLLTNDKPACHTHLKFWLPSHLTENSSRKQ